MFFGTLVTAENGEQFLPAVRTLDLVTSDIFVGVVDADTDTACGVLAAEAGADKDLNIRFIYVDEKWRRRGAGTTLLHFLQDLANDLAVTTISCTYNSYYNEENALTGLLEKAGFYLEEESSPLQRVILGDLDLKDEVDVVPKPIREMTRPQWNTLIRDRETSGSSLEPRGYYNENLSLFMENRYGELMGILLVTGDEQEIWYDRLLCYGEEKETIKFEILTAAIKFWQKQLEPDTKITFSFDDKTRQKMLSMLTDRKVETAGAIVMQTYEVPAAG